MYSEISRTAGLQRAVKVRRLIASSEIYRKSRIFRPYGPWAFSTFLSHRNVIWLQISRPETTGGVERPTLNIVKRLKDPLFLSHRIITKTFLSFKQKYQVFGNAYRRIQHERYNIVIILHLWN